MMRAEGTRRSGAAWMAAILLAELALGPAAPAWAQRRRAEPEADPEFREQKTTKKKKGGEEGGPIAPPEPEAAAEGAEAERRPSETEQQVGDTPVQPEPEAEPEPAADSKPQGMQIGASSGRRSAPAETGDLLETRIVVRVKSAPLAAFLDSISAQAKINFIITEGLEEKRITAFLQGVTVREALQILLEMKGLTYQRIGKSNTYVVSPRAKGTTNRITRIYTLSYIPLMDMTQGGVVADQSSGGSGGGSSSGGALGSFLGGSTPPPGGGQQQGGISILGVIRSVLSKEHGSLAIDSRTNAIIITDVPEVFPQVEQILAELDKKSPQIMIEAQIVEIDSDRAQQLGLEWGGAGGELGIFRGPVRDTTFPLNLPQNLANTHIFDPLNNVVSAVGQGAAGGGTAGSAADASGGSAGGTGASATRSVLILGSSLQTGILDLTSLRVVLRALVTRAEARFLGKPKILTLNNKKAVIQISQDQAVSIIQNLAGGGAGITSSTSEPERVKTGLRLSVTPQVNKDGYITMLVEPSFTNVNESKISVPSKPVFDPISRGASTVVRVKNGQTLVLGGLLESKETKAVRKVPLLGYIPLIGWLFTSTSNQRSNTDLVIFITPTIVND